MCKRKRYFVELREDQATMVSWTQLEDYGTPISFSQTAVKETVSSLNCATNSKNSSIVYKSRREGKQDVTNCIKKSSACEEPLQDRNMITYSSKRITRAIRAVKQELHCKDGSIAKGKVHRSSPKKSSCRTKKKTKACFCCPKTDGGSSSPT